MSLMPDAPSSPKDPAGPPSPPKTSMWAHAYGGMQLAIGVLLGFYGGDWLDGRLGSAPWLALAGAALGVLGGLYVFFSPLFPLFPRGPRGDR